MHRGLSALRILRVYPLNVSFTNLYSLEQHAGYEPDPLPDHPLVSEHAPSPEPARVSVTNEVYDSTNCLYPPALIDAFSGSIGWTWKCRWQIFGCTDDPQGGRYTKEKVLWDFNTDQVFSIRRDPDTGTVHYRIQKFKGLNKMTRASSPQQATDFLYELLPFSVFPCFFSFRREPRG
ncbi:MAG: hypothetical protein ACLT38_10425 [Akkermansia sp.]